MYATQVIVALISLTSLAGCARMSRPGAQAPSVVTAAIQTSAAASDASNRRNQSAYAVSPAPGTIADPNIRALVASILQCKFNELDTRFDFECAAYHDWLTSDVFEQEAGKAALLAMVLDPDVRVRALAITKELPPDWLEQDITRPRYLLEHVATETKAWIARGIADWLSHVDIERLGLQDLYRAMSQNPHPLVREASAHLFTMHKSAFTFGIVARLIDDADIQVQTAVAWKLALQGDEQTCAHVHKKVEQHPAFQVLAQLSYSRCDGVSALAMRQLFMRTTTPDVDALENETSISSAAATICSFNHDREVRRAGVAIGLRLCGEKWQSAPHAHLGMAHFGVRAVVACGGQSAKAQLQTLERSSNYRVAFAARQALANFAGAHTP
jgi:hypothetical protein